MTQKVTRIKSYEFEEYPDVEGFVYHPYKKNFDIVVPTYEMPCGLNIAISRPHGLLAISCPGGVYFFKTKRIYEIMDNAPDDVNRYDIDLDRDSCDHLKVEGIPTYIGFFDNSRTFIVCTKDRIFKYDTEDFTFVFANVRIKYQVKRMEFNKGCGMYLVSFVHFNDDTISTDGLVKVYKQDLEEVCGFPGFQCGSFRPNSDNEYVVIREDLRTSQTILTFVSGKKTQGMAIIENVRMARNVIWVDTDHIIFDGLATTEIEGEEDGEILEPDPRIMCYDVREGKCHSFDYAWPSEDQSRCAIFSCERLEPWSFTTLAPTNSDDPFFYYHKDEEGFKIGKVDDARSVAIPVVNRDLHDPILDGIVYDINCPKEIPNLFDAEEPHKASPTLFGLTKEGVIFCYHLINKFVDTKYPECVDAPRYAWNRRGSANASSRRSKKNKEDRSARRKFKVKSRPGFVPGEEEVEGEEEDKEKKKNSDSEELDDIIGDDDDDDGDIFENVNEIKLTETPMSKFRISEVNKLEDERAKKEARKRQEEAKKKAQKTPKKETKDSDKNKKKSTPTSRNNVPFPQDVKYDWGQDDNNLEDLTDNIAESLIDKQKKTGDKFKNVKGFGLFGDDKTSESSSQEPIPMGGPDQPIPMGGPGQDPIPMGGPDQKPIPMGGPGGFVLTGFPGTESSTGSATTTTTENRIPDPQPVSTQPKKESHQLSLELMVKVIIAETPGEETSVMNLYGDILARFFATNVDGIKKHTKNPKKDILIVLKRCVRENRLKEVREGVFLCVKPLPPTDPQPQKEKLPPRPRTYDDDDEDDGEDDEDDEDDKEDPKKTRRRRKKKDQDPIIDTSTGQPVQEVENGNLTYITRAVEGKNEQKGAKTAKQDEGVAFMEKETIDNPYDPHPHPKTSQKNQQQQKKKSSTSRSSVRQPQKPQKPQQKKKKNEKVKRTPEQQFHYLLLVMKKKILDIRKDYKKTVDHLNGFGKRHLSYMRSDAFQFEEDYEKLKNIVVKVKDRHRSQAQQTSYLSEKIKRRKKDEIFYGLQPLSKEFVNVKKRIIKNTRELEEREKNCMKAIREHSTPVTPTDSGDIFDEGQMKEATTHLEKVEEIVNERIHDVRRTFEEFERMKMLYKEKVVMSSSSEFSSSSTSRRTTSASTGFGSSVSNVLPASVLDMGRYVEKEQLRRARSRRRRRSSYDPAVLLAGDGGRKNEGASSASGSSSSIGRRKENILKMCPGRIRVRKRRKKDDRPGKGKDGGTGRDGGSSGKARGGSLDGEDEDPLTFAQRIYEDVRNENYGNFKRAVKKFATMLSLLNYPEGDEELPDFEDICHGFEVYMVEKTRQYFGCSNGKVEYNLSIYDTFPVSFKTESFFQDEMKKMIMKSLMEEQKKKEALEKKQQEKEAAEKAKQQSPKKKSEKKGSPEKKQSNNKKNETAGEDEGKKALNQKNMKNITLWKDHLKPFFKEHDPDGTKGLTKNDLAGCVFTISYNSNAQRYSRAQVPKRIDEVFEHFSSNILDHGNGRYSWVDAPEDFILKKKGDTSSKKEKKKGKKEIVDDDNTTEEEQEEQEEEKSKKTKEKEGEFPKVDTGKPVSGPLGERLKERKKVFEKEQAEKKKKKESKDAKKSTTKKKDDDNKLKKVYGLSDVFGDQATTDGSNVKLPGFESILDASKEPADDGSAVFNSVWGEGTDMPWEDKNGVGSTDAPTAESQLPNVKFDEDNTTTTATTTIIDPQPMGLSSSSGGLFSDKMKKKSGTKVKMSHNKFLSRMSRMGKNVKSQASDMETRKEAVVKTFTKFTKLLTGKDSEEFGNLGDGNDSIQLNQEAFPGFESSTTAEKIDLTNTESTTETSSTQNEQTDSTENIWTAPTDNNTETTENMSSTTTTENQSNNQPDGTESQKSNEHSMMDDDEDVGMGDPTGGDGGNNGQQQPQEADTSSSTWGDPDGMDDGGMQSGMGDGGGDGGGNNGSTAKNWWGTNNGNVNVDPNSNPTNQAPDQWASGSQNTDSFGGADSVWGGADGNNNNNNNNNQNNNVGSDWNGPNSNMGQESWSDTGQQGSFNSTWGNSNNNNNIGGGGTQDGFGGFTEDGGSQLWGEGQQ